MYADVSPDRLIPMKSTEMTNLNGTYLRRMPGRLKESLIKLIRFRRRNCVRMFHEVSSNSYSIAAIFGEDTGDFNKPKIIELDQSFLK